MANNGDPNHSGLEEGEKWQGMRKVLESGHKGWAESLGIMWWAP